MRNKDRQYIPTMPAAPALSIWQRLRGATFAAVAAVRSAGARVVALVARKVTGARAVLSHVVRAALVRRPRILTQDGIRHVAETVHVGNRAAAVRVVNWFRFQRKYAPRKVSSWTKSTWHRVVHPFMRVRVVVLGIGAVVVGLAVAPIATLVTLAVCGAVLIGLSHFIERFEASDRSIARVALRALEMVAQLLRVAAYIVAGAAVIAISAVSVVFAVTEVLELVLRYLDVPFAASLAALAFFVLTANWGLAVVETVWFAWVHEGKSSVRATRPHSGERQEIPLIRYDAERAWNRSPEPGAVEEVQETTVVVSVSPRCMGCDLDDQNPRYRVGNMSPLCNECFKCLIDDELIMAADQGAVTSEDVTTAIQNGIAVPAYVIIATGARLRSTRIDLDHEAITCRTEARVLSEQDPSRIHWAETGWWFDGHGNRRARRWHGFVGGRLATRAEYEHAKEKRGFYAMSLVSGTPGSWDRGPYRTLAAAQEAAADEISDHLAANVPGLEVVLDGALRSVS